MTDKPTALRLADALETELFVWDDNTVDLSVEIAAELRRLHTENETLRTDAERYRWLRTFPNNIGERVYGPTGALLRRDEYLDAAIDAAMGEKS